MYEPSVKTKLAIVEKVEEALEEEEEEVVEPNAFVDIGSGDLILVGCDIDEDGRVTVPADLARKIATRFAFDAPKADQERVAAELAKLAPVLKEPTKRPNTDWAKRIVARHEGGEKLAPLTLRMAREALANKGAQA